MDQDAATEEDEASFDPNHEQRDYAAIANSLPVFCVSSKAYHKMSGRLKSDEIVNGFPLKEDTEIPSLQEHARSMVESAHVNDCRRFLQDLRTFLGQIYLQMVVREPVNLAEEALKTETEFLKSSMAEIRRVRA